MPPLPRILVEDRSLYDMLRLANAGIASIAKSTRQMQKVLTSVHTSVGPFSALGVFNYDPVRGGGGGSEQSEGVSGPIAGSPVD